MDKKYIELFKELARATAVAAEQVMDYDKEKKDDKGFDTAKMMRDDFEALHEKISAETFNGELTKAEYAKMLVGCYVIVGNLQERIVALQKAVAGYQTDIVPKLSKIIEADTEEAAQTLAKELLVISEN
jgi:hypothetical protein